jgi:hypothetical protein
MTLPKKPNIRRIAFQRQCLDELEQYLRDQDMTLAHKEFLLDLAGLIDFLEAENYLGAHYIGTVIQERLKTKLPEWHRLAKLHVPSSWEIPIIEHEVIEVD